MASIEQAVFTSAETDRSAGYQLVAASPGVCEADARELSVWGPSHGALARSGPEGGVSFNFHPLPSGSFCVSRTTSAGREYSGRGGVRVYTQCLLVPPDVLARFANNPFAVLRAAMANGSLEVHQKTPRKLAPIRLAGRSAAVDSMLLARLCTKPGADWLATIVQATLSTKRVALCGGPAAEELIAGLINCLPPECRMEFSFSTGLKYSSRRPFRIVSLPDDKVQQRRLQHQYDMTILELDGERPAEFAPIDGWARFIQLVLNSSRTSFLAAQFSKRRFALSASDLPALGLQLLEEFDASAIPLEPRKKTPQHEPPDDLSVRSDWLDGLQRADAAHRRPQGGTSPASIAKQITTTPGKRLSTDNPEVMEKLELLDDLVFGAIDGNSSALEQLKAVWPRLHEELGAQLLAESREQYLRHALFIWEGSVESNGIRDSARAVQALDVLCVLFDEQ